MTHGLQLAREPFEAIASGRKTIESRLFDKKRKQIQLDDIIVCTNRDNLAQTLQARVIGLLRYRSFTDLFTHNDPTQFDGKNPDWLL
jgi:ASC-1-like (ASCH) protein